MLQLTFVTLEIGLQSDNTKNTNTILKTAMDTSIYYSCLHSGARISDTIMFGDFILTWKKEEFAEFLLASAVVEVLAKTEKNTLEYHWVQLVPILRTLAHKVPSSTCLV